MTQLKPQYLNSTGSGKKQGREQFMTWCITCSLLAVSVTLGSQHAPLSSVCTAAVPAGQGRNGGRSTSELAAFQERLGALSGGFPSLMSSCL